MNRPPPRTLSGTPSPQWRLPTASVSTTRLPTLATLLASGVVLPSCHEPVCGSARADELETHGRNIVPALRRGAGVEALREVGVALGLVEHQGTRATSPGAVPAVTSTPQPPPVAGGEAPAVTPLPQGPPSVAPGVRPGTVIRAGALRTTTPEPQEPSVRPVPPPRNGPGSPHPSTSPTPTRGRRMPVTPQPPLAIEGDVLGVSVLPPDLTRRT